MNPEHSLIVQSYKPREMISGTVNADGFGIGWYHLHIDKYPVTYGEYRQFIESGGYDNPQYLE